MSSSTRLPVTAWILSLMSLIGFGWLALQEENTLYTDFLIAIAAVLATWFTYRCTQQFEATEKPRRIWLHFSWGLGLWAGGELAWLGYELLVGEVPTPSLGDALWISGYIFLTTALLTQYRLLLGAQPRAERRILLLALFAILTGSAILGMLPGAESWWASFINAFYPLADLAIAGAALWLARQFGSGRWGRPWQALLLFALADAVYAWLQGVNLYQESLVLTAIADTLYFGAYVVLTLACYAQYRLLKRT